MNHAKSDRPRRLPHVGQRIVRSAIGVLLCFVVYLLRGRQGIPFYTCLAVLQCLQPYWKNTRAVARRRVTGTFVGAFWGFWVILLELYLLGGQYYDSMPGFLCVSLFTGVVLYCTVLLDVKDASYFSCVVFLSIVVNHIGDENPLLFTFNRVLDTLIGVAIAFAVNAVHLPRRMDKETLFVSGIDDTILRHDETLSAYSKVELNRLIEAGMRFTVSTIRTPASVREALSDIRLQLPIIAMDGAVLYDLAEYRYPYKVVMEPGQVEALAEILREQDMHCYTNTIEDDTLVIYYNELTNISEQGVYNRRRKSPWRNYVHKDVQVTENVVYLLVLDTDERIRALRQRIEAQPWAEGLRITQGTSRFYEGYSHIKIYHKDANRQATLLHLQEMIGADKTCTFGTIPGAYDCVIEDSDTDELVRSLKDHFAPVRFSMRPGSRNWERL